MVIHKSEDFILFNLELNVKITLFVSSFIYDRVASVPVKNKLKNFPF